MMLQHIFVFLVVLAMSPLVDAQSSSAERKAIDNALALTGVDTALEQLDSAYHHSLAVSKSGYELNDVELKTLDQALARFNAAAVKKQLRDYLLTQYQERPMQSVLSLQGSKVAEKFRSYERIASSPQQLEKQQQYLDTMDEHPFTETRLGLLRTLKEATHTVDFAALMKAHADVDTAVALDMVSTEFISRNDSQGVLLWQRKLEQSYKEQFDQFGDGYQIFAYRWINNDDVRKYIELWQDKNVQWFLETVLAGLRQVLQAQHKTLVEDLAP
ncbi:MAG: hypothetical protein ACR2P1_10320 [Pseudomonadales bacterium]